MTYASNNTLSTAQDQFESDFARLQSDLAAYSALLAQEGTDASDYRKKLAIMNLKLHPNPELALLYFLQNMFASSKQKDGELDSSTLLGAGDDQLGLLGKQLAVLGDTTQCTNDLENIMAGKDSSIQPGDDLKDVAGDSEQMLNFLKQSDVKNCLDSTTLGSLQDSFSQIRQMIHVGDHSPDDPALDASTVFFSCDPADTGKMASYAELNQCLAETGDVKGSTEAAKAQTQFTTNVTSQTQSTSNAVNEQVQQSTNATKQMETSFSSILKSLIDLFKQAVQNQVSR